MNIQSKKTKMKIMTIIFITLSIIPIQAQIEIPETCPRIQNAINVTDLWYFMRFMPKDTPTYQNAINLFKLYWIRKTITHPDYGQIIIVDVSGPINFRMCYPISVNASGRMNTPALYANMCQNKDSEWYCHIYNGCWRDYAGGTIGELEEAVNQEYGNDFHYHVLEIPYLRAWEKLEIKRLQEIEK